MCGGYNPFDRFLQPGLSSWSGLGFLRGSLSIRRQLRSVAMTAQTNEELLAAHLEQQKINGSSARPPCAVGDGGPCELTSVATLALGPYAASLYDHPRPCGPQR
ncbi:hypothetical protein AXF42_Ash008873 [Apostasia shenzhenica]|uniref:Uncharacterized protein n=1 Tax=Apostasia shenzhenica TaxID=1088818 RepID=A0A2I0ASW6_9ASPA|nr:hypothetical protein AXF42_Ash008873 [Apostasia shenzhenica]